MRNITPESLNSEGAEMRLIQYNDAEEFLLATTDFLSRDEAVNSLIMGLAIRLIGDPELYDSPPLFFSVNSENTPILAAMQTPPHNLIVYSGDSYSNMAGDTLLDHLQIKGLDLPGMIGPKPLCESLSAAYASRNELESYVQMNQCVYRLEKVHDIHLTAGELRLVAPSETGQVARWLDAFTKEIHGKGLDRQKSEKMAAAIIDSKYMYFWDHGGPVSMAGVSRPTANGITINYVYTPPEYRSFGFASSCVSQLSRLMLKKGYQFCTLFTDLKNPTSNKIYTNIGYQPVIEFVQVGFVTRKAEEEEP